MAYETTRASSQSLSAISPVSAVPMTISCFFQIPTWPTNMAIVTVGESGGTHKNQIWTTGTRRHATNSTGPLTSSGNATGNNAIPNNSWQHIVGVFESRTTRRMSVNGGTFAATVVDVGVQNALNEIRIGADWNTTLGNFFGGDIAEVGVWNVALNQQECASLAKGMTCDKVRPQSLVFYAPLVRDLIDQKGGLAITNNNGATVANHPRVYA
jgi:hypothetical protein